jgi:Resolvase, N terminal domain
MGRAMFTIIGAMAELESSLISERVTAGMKAAEVRGKHLGRPREPNHQTGPLLRAGCLVTTFYTYYQPTPFRRVVGHPFHFKSAGRSDRCRPGWRLPWAG